MSRDRPRDDKQRDERAHEFSRRELLRAGWSVPIALSVGSLAAACGGGGHDDVAAEALELARGDERIRRVPSTTSTSTTTTTTTTTPVAHTDTAHSDHADRARTVAHSDVPHDDHADDVDPAHVDTAHADSPHGDVAATSDHGDAHEDVPYSLRFETTFEPSGPGGDRVPVERPVEVQHQDVHVDTHPDTTHVDTPHVDTPHGDA